MSRTTLGEFIKMTSSSDGSPMLNFYWKCTYLPGHDPKYVESLSFPFPSLSVKEGLFGAGTYSYYPGFQDISAFDVVFYEDSKLRTTKWITAWRERIRNPSTGAYSLPGEYKENLEFHLLNTKGEHLATATFASVWPSERSNWDLTYTGAGERLTVQQNFSVDNLILKFT